MNVLPRIPSVFSSIVLASTLMTVAPGFAQDLTHPRDMNLAAPTFERPDPDALRTELPNGLVAYLARDSRAPLTSITLYLGLGSGHGEPGEAAALAAALRRGPEGLAPGAFAEQLNFLNAQYSVEQDHEETIVRLDVRSTDTADALEILADTLAAPDFGGNAAGNTPRAAAGGIDYAYSLDGAISLFEGALYATHRFGEDRDEVYPASSLALYERYLRSKNLVLAVAGDVDPSSLRRMVRSKFADIPEGNRPSPSTFAPLEPRDRRNVVLQEADRGQGWVVMGHELPPVPVADEAALEVMDYILGAYHLDSRLYLSSRERRGLTNDNSSFLRAGVQGPGSYTMRTYGRPEVVRLLVDVTFQQLDLIRETRVSDDELFVAKGALVDGIFAKRYATALDAVNAYAHEWLRYGSHDRSAGYAERVAAVTKDDVRAMAVKYIHPEHMIVAVVGPLENIRSAPALESEPQLSAWGKVINAQ